LLWDNFSQERIQACGSEKVKGWESLYVLRERQAFLGVYVDDLHMAGKSGKLAGAWEAPGKFITFGEINKFAGTTYLGCTRESCDVPHELVEEKRELFAPPLKESNFTAQDFDDREFKVLVMKPPRVKAKAKAKSKASLAKVLLAPKISEKRIRAWQYKMEGAAGACVERYLELSKREKSSLRKVAMPCIDDHMLEPTDLLTKGVLSSVASKAVLKCLYMARIARPELYWAVNALAREVTKWTLAYDKRMHRLISYIHHNQGVTMISYIAGDPRDCKLMLLCDASFAGVFEAANSRPDPSCV
jgi:hypothetical protein